MANVYCVFIKFCVFCLIFVELSQSNQINSDQYQYNIEEPHSLNYLDNAHLESFRAKRDVPPQSQPPSPQPATSAASSVSTSNTPETDKASIAEIPKVENGPRLLGANGTGQRKDYSTPSPTKTPDAGSGKPVNSDNKASTINTSLGAVQSPKPIEQPDQDDLDKMIGEIDEPEEAINKTFDANLKNETKKTDYHLYYNSTIIVDKNQSDEYWADNKEYIVNGVLSKSHRRAVTVQLKFDFPFYGHIVRNVTVATGGFLYTGEYVHSWLAATQYIAPLMANFDTSIGEGSAVKYGDNGTAFTVIWEKVPLQEGNISKPLQLFTFSVTLYNTGDITFAYKTIPIAIEMIKDEKHPVKIGLSDAYIIDKTIYFARRKTIYEYHRVNFSGLDIKNNTLVLLKALPTCLEYTECVSCLSADLQAFNCTWCPALNRCSIGTDRRRQDWVQNGCEKIQLRDAKTCPAEGTKGNNFSSQQQVTTPSVLSNNQGISNIAGAVPNASKSTDLKKAALSHNDSEQSKSSHASFALGILLPIIVVASLVMWVFYAYRNPHTKSGQLLIQYRPSQWSWRRGEARYTAATIHM